MTCKVLGALALSAVAISAPAFAQQDTFTLHISYGDLNLGSPAGAAAFETRVNQAINTACGDFDTGNIHQFTAMMRCRRQSRLSVKDQMQAAYAVQNARPSPRSIVLAAR